MAIESKMLVRDRSEQSKKYMGSFERSAQRTVVRSYCQFIKLGKLLYKAVLSYAEQTVLHMHSKPFVFWTRLRAPTHRRVRY